MNNNSIIERYGENFTDKVYITNPAIGRDEEIKDLSLILLMPDKSAIIIGKPGIGNDPPIKGKSAESSITLSLVHDIINPRVYVQGCLNADISPLHLAVFAFHQMLYTISRCNYIHFMGNAATFKNLPYFNIKSLLPEQFPHKMLNRVSR